MGLGIRFVALAFWLLLLASCSDSVGPVRGSDAGTSTAANGPDGGFPAETAASPMLRIEGATTVLSPGDVVRLTARAVWVDGSETDVTDEAEWVSSDPSVVAVGASGLCQIMAEGVAIIRVHHAFAGSAEHSLTVSAARVTALSVEPSLVRLSSGERVGLRATARFEGQPSRDVSEFARWSIDDGRIAEVAGGSVRGVSAGLTVVHVRYQNLEATAEVQVSAAPLVGLRVDPDGASVVVGEVRSLRAFGLGMDGVEREITGPHWTSSDTSCAHVDSLGNVRAVGPGLATITASHEGWFGTSLVHVLPSPIVSVSVRPSDVELLAGDTATFSAFALHASGEVSNVTPTAVWTIEDPATATLAGAGRATALALGTTRISATVGNATGWATLSVGAVAIRSITISPSSLALLPGERARLSARAFFSDGTTQDVSAHALWTSSDASVGSLGGGEVVGVSAGQADVRATYRSVGQSSRVTVLAGSLSLEGPSHAFDFGDVLVNQAATHSFTVHNIGTSAVTLGTVTSASLGLVAPFAMDAAASSCQTGLFLDAGARCTVVVTLVSATPGPVSASATLSYAGGTTPTLEWSLTGRITYAELEFTDGAAYAFGSFPYGQPESHTLTVRNVGTGSGALGQVGTAAQNLATPFEIDVGASTCTTSLSLAPGAQCSLVVRTSPVAAGTFADTLDLGYSGGTTAVVSLSLSATVTAALLSVTEGASYAFGMVFADQPVEHSFLVTNQGDAPAVLGTISAAGLGLADPFSLYAANTTCTTGQTLAPSASCVVAIRVGWNAAQNSSDTLDLVYAGGVAAAMTSSLSAAITSIGSAYHTCVTRSDGATKCWGVNLYGELGLGDVASRGDGANEMGNALPTIDLGPGRTSRRVANGETHTCALLDTAQVKCWGHNDNGELGLGDTASRGDQANEMGASLPAVDLGTGRSATSIALGGFHTCAILDTAELKCWGRNNYGQLGRGNTTPRGTGAGQMGDNLAAIDLGTGRTARAVSLGYYFTCAILDTYEVKCWGHDSYGQLGLDVWAHTGDGANEMGNNLPVLNLGTGRSARALAAGAHFVCALLDNGSVKCWGQNDLGQLGIGDNQNRGDAVGEMGDNLPAVDLGAGRTARSISAGQFHACALLDNGTIKCWGNGTYGALGLGDTANRGTAGGQMGAALPAVSLGTGRSARGLVAGAYHTCALLDNGTIKCWGRNADGDLGIGDTAIRGDGANELGDNLPVVNF